MSYGQNPHGQNPYGGQPQQPYGQRPYGGAQPAPYGQPQQPYGQPQHGQGQSPNPYGPPGQQAPYGRPPQQNPYAPPGPQAPYGQPPPIPGPTPYGPAAETWRADQPPQQAAAPAPTMADHVLPVHTLLDDPESFIVKSLGEVIGVALRPRTNDLGALTRARQDAVSRMAEMAKAADADAVVGLRFDSNPDEVVAYGTAVLLTEDVDYDLMGGDDTAAAQEADPLDEMVDHPAMAASADPEDADRDPGETTYSKGQYGYGRQTPSDDFGAQDRSSRPQTPPSGQPGQSPQGWPFSGGNS